MAPSVHQSNKRKILRKVAALKDEYKGADGVVNLEAVKLALQSWGETEPWISGEQWSDWAERHVRAEDEETRYRSTPLDLDAPRFDFWYTEHRNDWLKITEGTLGDRVRVCEANGDHWRLWRAIRTDNFERIESRHKYDMALGGEMIRQFDVRPHCKTTDAIMREAFAWTEPAAEPAEIA